MLDLVKKGLYIGLGLASLTKERVETLAKDLTQYTKLSEEEGRKLAEFLQTESKKARENLRGQVDSMVQAAVDRLPSAARVEQLEKRIAALEAAAGIKPPATPAEPPPAATP